MNCFVWGLVSEERSEPIWSMFAFLVCVFFYILSCYCVFYVCPLLLPMFFPFFVVTLLVASQCNGWVFLLLLDLWEKLSIQVSGYTDLYIHCRELMKSVGNL
jgi:hypothetical protein